MPNLRRGDSKRTDRSRSGSRLRSRSRSHSPVIARRSHSGDSNPYICLLPIEVSDDIAGPANSNLERICKDTKASIVISKSDEQPNDLLDKVLTITGTSLQKLDALCCIIERMRSILDLRRNEEGTFVMLVPIPVCAMVIGRRGFSLHEIRKQTYCDVMLDEESVAGTQCRPAILRGDYEATKSAVKRIQKIITDYVVNGKQPEADFKVPGYSGNTRASTPRSEVRTQIPTRVLVNSDCAGFLIGKGGQGLSRMRAKTGADILISKQMGTDDRFVIIDGSMKDRMNAIDMLIDEIRDHRRLKSRERSNLILVVPERCAATIIGKSGNAIRDLRESSRTNIDIADTNISGTKDRAVTIRGDAENILSVVKKLTQVVDQTALQSNMTARDFEVPGYVASR